MSIIFVRHGKDPDSEPVRRTEAMKNFNEYVSNHPLLDSIILPLGDGILMARVGE